MFARRRRNDSLHSFLRRLVIDFVSGRQNYSKSVISLSLFEFFTQMVHIDYKRVVTRYVYIRKKNNKS